MTTKYLANVARKTIMFFCAVFLMTSGLMGLSGVGTAFGQRDAIACALAGVAILVLALLNHFHDKTSQIRSD